MSASESVRLSRRDAEGAMLPTPPARIVHLGVGAFMRAHQAWYTSRAPDSADWGIVGFTGRSPEVANLLEPQDGLYTLIERGPVEDRFEIVGSLVAVHPGDRVDLLVAALRDPDTSIVTMTITEAGYRLDADGAPDLADPLVAADVDLLRAAFDGRAAAHPSTALGRMLLGLDARRRDGAPSLAIVPCDNVPDNGGMVHRALVGLAEHVGEELAEWLDVGVTWVSTSVDRITPRLDPRDIEMVHKTTGRHDAAPVVTEQFTDWILCGEFPAGRPDWEAAGARFVDDIEPYESRKLWLLNGAHTLLASLGVLRGHDTVAEAIADPVCLTAVGRLWDEGERQLPTELGIPDYRRALLERFRNPRIAHHLGQIASDARTKLRLRVVPVAERERAAGRSGEGCAAAIAAWILVVEMGVGAPDPDAAGVRERHSGEDLPRRLLELIAPNLSEEVRFRATVEASVLALRSELSSQWQAVAKTGQP